MNTQTEAVDRDLTSCTKCPDGNCARRLDRYRTNFRRHAGNVGVATRIDGG